MSDSDAESVQGALRFEDSLVTNEGEWIHSHKPHLLQIWRLLKQGCARFSNDAPYCSMANFHIFASFVYRWTGTGETSSDDEDMVLLDSLDSLDSDGHRSEEEGENDTITSAATQPS